MCRNKIDNILTKIKESWNSCSASQEFTWVSRLDLILGMQERWWLTDASSFDLLTDTDESWNSCIKNN